MTLDKPMAFLVFSIVVALVAFGYFLSTFVPRHGDDVILNKKESDVSSITAPTTNATDVTASSYPTLSTPTTDNRNNDILDDRSKQSGSFGSDQTNQSLDNLTEDEIWILIEDLEKKRTELHEVMEYQRKLSDLAQDRMFDLDDKFYAMFNENLKERQALTKDFEHNELNGASLDETSRSATPEELEELASRPGARSLLEALLQEKAIGKQWTAQSKALADEGNALTAEYAAIYQQILAIDKSIAELKSMLP